MADVVEGGASSHDVQSLLSSPDRDFLIRNNGDQVKVDSLKGKKLGLYFSASWCGPCHRFTPILAEVYDELSPKGDLEIIFISADKDEGSFSGYFSKMPWLAIPFSDLDKRNSLDELFKVRGIPHLVILDGTGTVLTDSGVAIVREYGVEGHPFTPERIKELKDQEEAARINQSLTSLLVHGSRNFVVSSNRNQVPVTELEGKTVGLYFSLSVHRACVDFTPKLLEVYEKLKARGESFEIVQIPLDDDEASFNQSFGSMPWLSLPFKDKKCKKLVRYFELSTLPTLVIIGQDGKTVHANVAETVEEHGIATYPFTPEKFAELAEIEKQREESQTLESILVSGDLDFVIGKDGTKIPVSDLVGKTILLYFSAHWCPPCRAFLPVLSEAYEKIKATDDAFEVIFISSDKDQTAFDDYFAQMPWLALPFGDERKKFLSRRFKVKGIPMLVAIGPTGRTVSKKARDLIMDHGADAYPFTAEHLKKFEEKFKESIKGWPEKLKHPLHEKHELVPAQRRRYNCDGCGKAGEGWSYYCEECDFDLHPKCAVKEEKTTKNELDEDAEAAGEEAEEGGDAKEG
ncbi:probable nucleoredoxin 1 isoform X1 [Eucalyptus grandis]|uniref:probable nucleoredoxin 1 isoform X1 n=1 Tax=Eucalyptus grandis TaxID=71139 RepID=UPI00192EC0A3|nr:probable nucleoredoxin 1 isoform X1 [Eucalyptus grandis]